MIASVAPSISDLETRDCWGLPDGPVVETLPSSAGGAGSIPGQGTKVPHATGCAQK